MAIKLGPNSNYKCFVIINDKVEQVSTSFDFDSIQYYCIESHYYVTEMQANLPNGWKLEGTDRVIDKNNILKYWKARPDELLNFTLKYKSWEDKESQDELERIKKMEARLEYLERIEKHYWELKSYLIQIKSINLKGGPGSRRKVNNIIHNISFIE